jgi:hypothetical protein
MMQSSGRTAKGCGFLSTSAISCWPR